MTNNEAAKVLREHLAIRRKAGTGNPCVNAAIDAAVVALEAVASGDYDYTVDEICNAYESGVGHRGRPTAKVNPYRHGSELAAAYNLGAVGEREQQVTNNDAEADGA